MRQWHWPGLATMNTGNVENAAPSNMRRLSGDRLSIIPSTSISASEQTDIEAALERDGILEDSWTQHQGSRGLDCAGDAHQEAMVASPSLPRRLRKSHSMFPLCLPTTDLPERPRRPSMIQKGLQMFLPSRRVAASSFPEGESSRASERRRRPSFLQRVGHVAHRRHPSLAVLANAKTEEMTVEQIDFLSYSGHLDSSSSCLLNPSGGAAARAAAAAQNEKALEASRAYQPEDSHHLDDAHVTGDSESGICIDLREQMEDVEPHNRQGTTCLLRFGPH